MSDPLTDPRVIAARSRVTTVERVRERFAEPTAEAAGGGTATMRIYGRIDADGAPWGISAQDVATAIDALPEDTKRLDVHIHSRGGDAFEGLAILNQLRQAKQEVHVTVDGLAASAASAIAMAGKTITMAPSSQMMVHDASGIGIGQAADMRILADALDSISQSYAAAYASKAGGTADEWRALMQPETWYRADEAVKARLANGVLKTEPDAPKATATYDLSIFAYAGRDNAPEPTLPTAATQTPAEPPVVPTPTPKEADTMSDTLIQGLRERFAIAEDADESAILAAIDADSASREKQIENLEAAVTTAKNEAPDGKTIVSENVLTELREQAKAGAEARAQQLAEERDETITAAVTAGKISRERVEAWAASWDKDPEGTKADLDSLPARFPVGKPRGHMGGDDTGREADYTAEHAAEDAELFGLPKEAFLA